MKLWTLGREREKQHVRPHFNDEAQRSLLFGVIDAVHDLKEGGDDPETLISAARCAFTDGNSGVVQLSAEWVAKVAGQIPAVRILWDELAAHSNWQMRWYVACRLYGYMDEDQSDRLFAILRHDRSKKVRDIAVSRYEVRVNDQREYVKMFDAAGFDDRVKAGEIKLIRAIEGA